MAWSASKVFAATITDLLNNTTAIDGNADTFTIALYNNTITPDATVASANTAYDVAQWATAQEVYDGAEWAQTGRDLDSVTSVFSGATYTFDAANEVSGTSATLANVYGCLIYDTTIAAPVANQGMCFLYFGGVNSVTDGTLTVAFNGSGIFTIGV